MLGEGDSRERRRRVKRDRFSPLFSYSPTLSPRCPAATTAGRRSSLRRGGFTRWSTPWRPSVTPALPSAFSPAMASSSSAKRRSPRNSSRPPDPPKRCTKSTTTWHAPSPASCLTPTYSSIPPASRLSATPYLTRNPCPLNSSSRLSATPNKGTLSTEDFAPLEFPFYSPAGIGISDSSST